MSIPRVYALLDGGVLGSRAISFGDAAEALLDGGVRLLQIRWKGHYSRTVFDQAVRVARLCREAEALLVVNDRADVAMLLDAGLHVGQDDLPPSDARRLIGPSRSIGYSTHNLSQFRAANVEPVDYIALGPIFTTTTKDKPDPVVGLAGLADCRPLTTKPIVAIGGITRESARAVWNAGADSIAVCGDLYPARGGTREIRERAEEWLSL